MTASMGKRESGNASAHTRMGPFGITPRWIARLGLSPRALQLYVMLASIWADTDAEGYPSRATLAKVMGCSVDVVDRAAKEAVEAGALLVENRYDGRGQTSNLWIVLQDDPSRKYAAHPPEEGRTDAAPGAANSRPELDIDELDTPQPLSCPTSPATPDAEVNESTVEQRFCEYFVKQLLVADPTAKRPKITVAWLKDADRLFRLDERDKREAREVIDWIFTNPAGHFWIANCRSVPTFRKQYERMRAQMRDRGASRSSTPVGRDELTEGVLDVGPGGYARD